MITKSLMFQLSIIIVMITSTVLAGFGYYRFQVDSSHSEDHLQEELTMTTERLAISLSTPLYSYHDEGIRSVILSEMKNSDIVGIYIVDPWASEQNYWYSKDANGIPVVVNEFPLNDTYISSSLPIVHNSEEIGTLYVYISTERVYAQIQAELESNILQIIILDVVLIIFVIFLLRVKVIRPISKLESISQEIAKGDLDQIIKIQGNDEISKLGRAFNIMTGNLKESQERIKLYSKNLEQLVESRTKELNLKVEELQRFKNVTVDRELKMIKLKNQIKELRLKQNGGMQDSFIR